MTTSWKLWLGFAALTAVVVVLVVAILIRVWSIERHLDELETARQLSAATRELEINILGYGLEVRRFLRSAETQAAQDAMKEALDVQRYLEEYERLATSDRQQSMAARFATLWREYQKLGQDLLRSEMDQMSPDGSQRFHDLRAALEKMLDDELQPDALAAISARRNAALSDARAIGSFALTLLVLGVVVAVVTSVVVGRAIYLGRASAWRARRTAANDARAI